MRKANKQLGPNTRMKSIVKAEIRNGVLWFTAQQVTKKTGWDTGDLEVYREEGNVITKRVGKKGYRYEVDSVIHLYKKLKEF